jgi:NitT/TauT family transport system ATP-binding protein
LLLHVDIQRKIYHNGQAVLQSQILGDLAFDLRDGEIRCLFGASGCGKSTMLRLIAGVDSVYEGEVMLDRKPVTGPTRTIGMVMQGDASFPWLTVAENITFAMRYNGSSRSLAARALGITDRREAREKARELAALVQLPIESLDRYPGEISGGMKQRMLFARALLSNPRVLLLDEPFSSLDYESRQKLQNVVIDVRDRLGIAYICVSHDPDETLFIADEILLLSGKPARIVQRRSPGFRGDRAKQFTVEFQQAKQELHGWLSS